jgi:hypothetical protein
MEVLSDVAAFTTLGISMFTFSENIWKRRKADIRVYLRRVKDESVADDRPAVTTRFVLEIENQR